MFQKLNEFKFHLFNLCFLSQEGQNEHRTQNDKYTLLIYTIAILHRLMYKSEHIILLLKDLWIFFPLIIEVLAP